jgi:hypothetical protein
MAERTGDGKRRQGLYVDELGAFDPVDLVTLSIGGNDAQWSEVLIECPHRVLLERCRQLFRRRGHVPPQTTPLTAWVERRLSLVTERVEATMGDLKAAAPDAAIVVAGYPHLAPASEDEQRCGKFDPPRLGEYVLRPSELGAIGARRWYEDFEGWAHRDRNGARADATETDCIDALT